MHVSCHCSLSAASDLMQDNKEQWRQPVPRMMLFKPAPAAVATAYGKERGHSSCSNSEHDLIREEINTVSKKKPAKLAESQRIVRMFPLSKHLI